MLRADMGLSPVLGPHEDARIAEPTLSRIDHLFGVPNMDSGIGR